jgi:hypothetical protein
MIGGSNIRNFMDALIGDMAVNHSFYGISYKEYIDPDTSISQEVKAKFVTMRKDLLSSRIWQYRVCFIRDNITFAVYTIAEEIPDTHINKLRDSVTHIRQFFKESSVDQLWEIALQQFVMYSMLQMYEIEKSNQAQQQAQIQHHMNIG